MRLAAAARRFNKTRCLDGYTGAYLFDAQLPPFDDSKRDAEVAERRIISLSPDVALPTRRVIEASQTRYILGHGTFDLFMGRAIRLGVVGHECSTLAQIRTLGQACRVETGTQAWANKSWLKNLDFSEQNSNLPREVHIHVAATESAPLNSLITMGTAQFLVRQVDDGASGIRVILADEQPGFVTAQVSGSVYDPVMEAWTGAPATINVLRLRWQSLFSYQTYDSAAYGPGDDQFVMAKVAFTPRPGTRMTLPTGNWTVDAVASLDDVWVCRGSRHG